MSDVMPGPTTMPGPTSATPPPDAGLAAGVLGGDGPVRATDTVERVVDSVRSKTTGPAIVVSRVVVYGLVAAVLALVALVLVLVSLVRLLDVYLPRGVWLPDLILGAVLALAGGLAWHKRSPRHSDDGA
jgi:hypothetical protein